MNLVTNQYRKFKKLHIGQDQEFEFKLRYVRIYFYATTFDRITKDRAAKGEAFKNCV